MKKISFLLTSILLGISLSCQDAPKNKENERNIEIKIEKSDTNSKATITIKKTINGRVSEEVQTIEGVHEDVMKKVDMLSAEVEEGTTDNHKIVKQIKFKLNPKSETNTSGEVSFTEEDGKVSMNASIMGLSPGIHAIHIHEKADCSSPDGKSTGGHWNPTFQPHGAWGAEAGYHRGDIGNFNADENGNGMIRFSTDLWCIGCDDSTKNIMGKAIIVHQGEDDLTSQPSGAAGARISCAGIIQ